MNSGQRRYKRLRCLDRDGLWCGLCGEIMQAKDYSLDHIIPVSKGGGDSVDNLWVTHVECNTLRADKDLLATPVFELDRIAKCDGCGTQTSDDVADDHCGRWFNINDQIVCYGAKCIKRQVVGREYLYMYHRICRRVASRDPIKTRKCAICAKNNGPKHISQLVTIKEGDGLCDDQYAFAHGRCYKAIGKPNYDELIDHSLIQELIEMPGVELFESRSNK